ncbi:MAG: sigma-70 family RNA polymerase sigma factor [Kribbellaceae bacterium]|nr:sigma-70 family RNA polymerase sigma factor [Kribbellaceae bacterium]
MSCGPVTNPRSRADEAAVLESLLRSAHAARGRRRQELLDQAVAAGLPLARTLARRFRGRGIDDEDLEQIACEHLIRAVRNYRPSAGSDFRSYAVPTIRGGIRHHFRDHAWAIKLPRRLQEIQTRVNTAQTALATELGHWPSHCEIAAALGVDVADVIEAEQARGCFQPVSLDAPHPSDHHTVSLERTLADPGNTFALVDQVHTLRPVVQELPPRDQLILHRRFVDHYTQAEIGAEIGVSQMQVSRRLRDILTQLRLALAP